MVRGPCGNQDAVMGTTSRRWRGAPEIRFPRRSEGLKLVDVAFGVQKIICTAVVNQTLSMDAIIEEITEDLFADEVQSMSMTSMSLL